MITILLIISIIGFIVCSVRKSTTRKLETARLMGWLRQGCVAFAIVCIGLLSFNDMFFYLKPGYNYHVTTKFGQERFLDSVDKTDGGVGYSWKGFGTAVPWKKEMTIVIAKADNNKENEDAEGDTLKASYQTLPLNLTFLDQVTAKGEGTVRFILPADDDNFKRVVASYRTPTNFLNTALVPAVKETFKGTASMMTAEEYYSGGQTSFMNLFEEQMMNGLFMVKRQKIQVANVDKDNKRTDQTHTRFQVVRLKTEDGLKDKIKSQKFLNYGITVREARVTDMVPNKAFLNRMTLKQEASANRAIAEEKRIQEEQERFLAIARGEREIAQKKAEAEKVQITRTTNAETEKKLALIKADQIRESAEIARQTAEINLKKTKIEAKGVKIEADAVAYARKKKLTADNALDKRLRAYVEVQTVYADALSKKNVPSHVFGASKGLGANDGSDIRNFMNIMTMKASKDLGLDLKIGQ